AGLLRAAGPSVHPDIASGLFLARGRIGQAARGRAAGPGGHSLSTRGLTPCTAAGKRSAPPCRPASTTRTAEAFCPNAEEGGSGTTHDPGPSCLCCRTRFPGWAIREDRARTGARNRALRENPETAMKPAISLARV